jgi:hypothetical protein
MCYYCFSVTYSLIDFFIRNVNVWPVTHDKSSALFPSRIAIFGLDPHALRSTLMLLFEEQTDNAELFISLY